MTDSNAEPDGGTLFRIGSITKAFTGQVLASLAADGVVTLADPLTKYVPDFIAPLSEGGRPIRLVDLATHSAGLPREVPHAPGPPDDPFANITREAFVAWLKANPLLFTPGTSILYSNFGFDLLAAALSAAAQKPYPDLIAERVLKPLGLADTTFAPSGRSDGAPHARTRFRRRALALCRRPDRVIVGSGGLYSTPARSAALAAMASRPVGERGRRRAAHRPRRLSLARRAELRLRHGRVGPHGRDGPRLGRSCAPEGDRPLILQKAGGLQGIFSYVAFAPMRNIGVMAAINAFDFNAGLAIAKAANDLHRRARAEVGQRAVVGRAQQGAWTLIPYMYFTFRGRAPDDRASGRQADQPALPVLTKGPQGRPRRRTGTYRPIGMGLALTGCWTSHPVLGNGSDMGVAARAVLFF